MGEIAALGAAFDAEFGKSLSSLPALEGCPVTEHDAHLNHYRAAQRVQELIAYYGSRLPPYASVQRILTSAEKLVKRGEHKLAKDACYTYVRGLALHEQRGVQRMDDQSKLSYHVQACMGIETCEAALTLQADAHIKHPRTLAGVVACLKGLQAATVMVLPVEALYWLTLNGTIHMYQLVKRLLAAGFVQQVLPYVVFCVKAMETHVIFSTAKYLPWRTQLYVTLCNAYFDVRAYDLARTVIREGLDKIDALIKLQKLDPVPAIPEVQAAYRTARATLSALQLRLEVMSAPPEAPVEAAPAKGAAAAKPGKGAPPPPEDVLPASLEPLKPLLGEVSLTPVARLTALMEALQVPGRRVVRHEPPALGLHKDMFELVAKEAMPMLAALKAALVAYKEQQAAQLQQGGQQAAAQQQDGQEGGQQQQEGDGAAGGGEQQTEGAATAATVEVDVATPSAALPVSLHKVLLCTAYNLEQQAVFEEALEVGDMRLQQALWSHHAPGLENPGVEALGSAVAILRAVSRLEKAPGAETLADMANTMLSCAKTAAVFLPDVLADASLVLYMTARPLLDGVYCGADKEAGLVLLILRSLHACWSAADVDDPVARLCCAIKLALLLEDQQESEVAAAGTSNAAGAMGSGGPLYEAREVLASAAEVAERFRSELMMVQRNSPDEHLRWISASRSQPTDEAAKLLEGMSDTEQSLACMHADVMAALFRVELKIGVSEQQARSTTKMTKLFEIMEKRDTQSAIFGTRTLKEKREETARLEKAAAVPSNPPVKERELLQSVGRNMYEKALLLVQMVDFQTEARKQNALLQEAADCLVKAQASEDALFAMAQPDLRSKQAAPLQPKILQRTPNSCTLVHFPLHIKGNKRPARYCILAKTYGAGVGLSINKTAMEYPGTGIQVPLDQPITVEGLRRNETYIFAVAAYDESGALLGGLGTSSREVPAALPLPLYLCWAHLLLAASRARQWTHARRAAAVLLPHFIATTPDRPLWEANPMDAQSLHRGHVAVAARPLLRAFVQATLLHTPMVLAQDVSRLPLGPLASAAGATPTSSLGPEYRAAYIEEQVVRLKAVKTLQLAMEVAACLPDEMLVQEGALRMHNMLAPLLVLQPPPTQVHKALAALHLSLQGVANLVQESMVGQEANRSTAARALASATYYLVNLSTREGEATAAAHFGKLQVELLRAYDPKFSIPGRPPTRALQPEASSLQDVLLGHRRLLEFGSEVLTERMKDEGDLAARTLPMLSGPAPLDAWAVVLGKEEAVENPRWVELVVRTLEASIQKGITDGVQAVALQVAWHVRTAMQRPPLDFTRWSLDEAAAGVTAEAAATAAEVPPAPEGLEAMPAEQRAEAEGVWERAKDEALDLGQRRVAAATLLQQRLPALMKRKRAIEGARAAAARWAPWLARMNAALGLAAAAQGRAFLQDRAKAAAAAAQVLMLEEQSPPPVTFKPDSGNRGRSPSPAGKRGASPSPVGGPKRSGSASPKKPGTPQQQAARSSPFASPPAQPADPAEGLAESPAMASLQHLARAAHLAFRGRAWHELLNSSRHLWNVGRMLLNLEAAMTLATPQLVWEQAPMPPPPSPPESSIAPAAASKDAKGGKGGAAGKTPEKKPADKKGAAATPKKGAKGGDTGGDAGPGTAPLIWLPTGARSNSARHLRSAAQALLALVDALRKGAPLYTGVLPLLDGSTPGGAAAAVPPGQSPHAKAAGATGALGDEGAAAAEKAVDGDDAVSYVTSAFSFGSDLQADLWYQRVPLDMAWVNRFVVLVLTVLVRMRRWHAVLELGEEWVRLSEGAFNEKVLPLMMQAATEVQSPSSGRLQGMMEVVVRDKNQALDQLDKVRTLVRKRLGEASLLGVSGVASKIRKKRRAGKERRASAEHHSGAEREGSCNDAATDVMSTAGSMKRAESTTSAAYTYGTATTFKTKASQPDHMRMPTEYEKVIEFLKKRGEKGAMILATNEMGDAHAHFGNWRGATTAWNDALDTLIGPYQVLKCWRKALEPQSREQLLQSYGLHGLLLAGGVLLGKLARYSHYDNLGTRLEAARMASTLLAAVFCASIVHPQRHADFATYLPLHLWDGCDLFADPYRCNVQDLLSGLETLACILIDNDFSLDALPMLALWDYVSCRVARSVHHTVRCRLARARALVQLGMVHGASRITLGLLAGAGLPDPTLDCDLVLQDESTGRPLVVPEVPPLQGGTLPGDAANQPALAALAESVLPPALDTLYGSWAVAHLNLVRATLLLRLGGFPNLWKATHPHTGLRMSAENPVPEAREPQLLDQAAALIARALAMASGEAMPEPASGAPAAGGKAAAGAAAAKKAAPAPAKKGAAGAGAGGSRPTSPSRRPPSPAGPVTDDQTSAAQRSEVMVRALLLLSEADLLRWQPAKALAHAEGALAHMATHAEKLNATLSDNDDMERLALSPGLWLMARMQAVRCTAGLGHGEQAAALIARSLDEAAHVNDPLRAAQLLHIQANLFAGRGQAAAALNTYQDVLTRYQALSLRDPRIACLLMDAATLRDGLGLRSDCERLVGAARVYLEAWTAALGLHEMQEHPELINLYSSGTALYALALELSARCATRRQQLSDAQAELEHALLLLRKMTRVLPTQQAGVALALARVARVRALSEVGWSHSGAAAAEAASADGDAAAAGSAPEAGNGGGGAAAAAASGSAPPARMGLGDLLAQARGLLAQALTLSTLDGAHQHGLMRDALLELASLHVAADEVDEAAQALKSAHAAACKGMLVTMSSHLLTPVTVAQLPDWAVTYARGQEQYFNAKQGHPDAPIADVDLGRVVVRSFLSLGQRSVTAPVADRPRLDAQRCMLHTALRSACPKYAADGCFADVPLPAPPAAAVATCPPPGTVIVQWHVHPDGCSRESASWVASGSLPASGISESQLLALRPVPAFVSMLFLVVPPPPSGLAPAPLPPSKKPTTPPSGAKAAAAAAEAPTTADPAVLASLRMGERTFPVELVREVQGRVKALRHRMESPRLATDLFGDDAPTGEELGRMRATIERLLSQRRWSADGQRLLGPSLDGDDDDMDPATGPGRGDEGADEDDNHLGIAAVPGVSPALDIPFLVKMEGMFSLESGVDMVDAGLAGWLSKLLPARA